MTLSFFIDGQKITAKKGQSVLQAALAAKIDIPHVCFGNELRKTESCRTCIVENEETGKITVSCTLIPKEGMRLSTKTPMVQKGRKTNLELVFAGHAKRCPNCKAGRWCKIAKRCELLGLDLERFAPRTKQGPIDHFDNEPCIEFDPTMCINCKKCIETCRKCSTSFLQEKGYGTHATAGTLEGKISCIFCGQCTTVCPTGALREVSTIRETEAALADPDTFVIIQPAPAVRAALGEGWGKKPDKKSTGKMYAALRSLGADKIFDINFGADITTYVEAEELANRIQNNGVLPMFTSCCPAWVRYVEAVQPQLIPDLTTARSPHIHSGSAYKTWWATENNIDPKKICVISVVPCTSKKYESRRKELWLYDKKVPPVDICLTTRELIIMLKSRGVEWDELKQDKADSLAEHSGAAAIYGASGGVMESALRSMYWQLTGENMPNINFKPARGLEGVKHAKITIGKLTIRVGVVSGVRNLTPLLNELKKNPETYHYIEVMACPGGCIGGGGQPQYKTKETLKERQAALYDIDSHKKIRTAHQNPELIKYFSWLDTQGKDFKKSVLETHGYTNHKEK